jgi:hypothetical protein
MRNREPHSENPADHKHRVRNAESFVSLPALHPPLQNLTNSIRIVILVRMSTLHVTTQFSNYTQPGVPLLRRPIFCLDP